MLKRYSAVSLLPNLKEAVSGESGSSSFSSATTNAPGASFSAGNTHFMGSCSSSERLYEERSISSSDTFLSSAQPFLPLTSSLIRRASAAGASLAASSKVGNTLEFSAPKVGRLE